MTKKNTDSESKSESRSINLSITILLLLLASPQSSVLTNYVLMHSNQRWRHCLLRPLCFIIWEQLQTLSPKTPEYLRFFFLYYIHFTYSSQLDLTFFSFWLLYFFSCFQFLLLFMRPSCFSSLLLSTHLLFVSLFTLPATSSSPLCLSSFPIFFFHSWSPLYPSFFSVFWPLSSLHPCRKLPRSKSLTTTRYFRRLGLVLTVDTEAPVFAVIGILCHDAR